MPSDKPRIATYTTKENVRKCKILAAYHNLSMSEYLEKLIKDSISTYEQEHGEIIIDTE